MMRPFEPTRSTPSRARLASIALITLTLTLVGGPGLRAQDDPAADASADNKTITQAIVEIRHADVEELDDVLRVFGIHAQAHPDLGLITLQGPPDAVAAAKAAAASLDRPPAPSKNVEITAYVLEASKSNALDGGVPPALDGVAGQLRNVFGFAGVELVDTLVVTVLDGSAGQVSGTFPASAERYATGYRFGFNRADVIPGDRPSVRLRGLTFESQVIAPEPAEGEQELIGNPTTRLVTDVEVRTGQKAVVGKAASVNLHSGTTILVIEVKVAA